MDDRSFQFFFWVVTAGTAAAIGWLFKLQTELSNLRLHIAESYPSNSELEKFENKLDQLGEKLDQMLQGFVELRAEVKAKQGG